MQMFTCAHTRRHLIKLGTAALPLIVSAGCKMDDPHLNHERRKNEQQHNCFLKGTRIATPLGDHPVEKLQVGDEVHTHDGVKPIRWIGYDKFEKSEESTWNKGVMPIRVARFAIDNRTPRRDLYLSPAHCLYIDGFLIPVVHLINESSIAAHMPSPINVIEYYHIEFDEHEVIFAEGTPVESYLPTKPQNFSNFVEYERLRGIKNQSSKTPFAPLVGYYGGRDELKGFCRYLISNVVDVRDPIQVAWDRIAARATMNANTPVAADAGI